MGHDLVGRSLAHFQIDAELGEGGMGVVYRATDDRLRRPVALKVLPESFAADEDRRRRFLREARSAAAVTHANIATVFEVGEVDGLVFIAMELVEGETLRARISKGMSVAEGVRVAKDIARGMGRAHEKGIVHRDLKPENVMITPRGDVKILDFGLAKLRDGDGGDQSALEQAETEPNLTLDGRVLGTPAYMSPEQAKGERVDARTDIFSFGVLFFEMLTGKRPFAGNTAIAVLVAASSDSPKRVSDINPEAWADVDRVVERCLAKKPADRFANGDELLGALEGLDVRSEGALRRSATAPATLRSGDGASATPHRSGARRIWVMTVTALIFAAAGSTIVLWRSRSPPAATPSMPSASSAAPAVAQAAGRAMTSYPPPRTTSPEAAAAYAAGLQAYRDGSLGRGLRDMQDALTHDPRLAAAHLRLGLQYGGTSKDLREHDEAALQSRAVLDARDQELLAFLNAKAGLGGDAVLAARTLIQKLPDDPEALMWAARYLNTRGLEAEALVMLDHALAIDPAFAGAAHERAVAYGYLGDAEHALGAAEACLAIPPGSPSCLRRRADVNNVRGECAELGRDAERLIAMEQDGFPNYSYGVAALAARGAPVEALASLLRKGEAHAFGRFLRQLPLDDAARLAVYDGDFTAAEKSLKVLAQDTDEDAEARGMSGLLWIYREEGDTAKAAATAEPYFRELPAAPSAWDGEYGGRPPLTRPLALLAMRLGGRLSASDARATRDAWVHDWTAITPARLQGTLWTWFYAYEVVTPADAREALAALPDAMALPSYGMNPQLAGAVGRVYALAGDVDAALPLLRAEAMQCGTVMPSVEHAGIGADVQQLEDRALLGETLASRGDRDGACSQYAVLLARWGHAKPRSVTAEKARADSKALGCH